MKMTTKAIAVLVIFAMAIGTVYAGGWSETAEPMEPANLSKTTLEEQLDEVDKILESFMNTEDFDNKFFAKKAGMTVDEFEEFLKKPVSEKKEVTEEQIRAVGCMRCLEGGKYIEIDRGCSIWSATGKEKKCPDYNFGVDLELVRSCYSVKRCDKCGFEITGNWKEYTWECHGFNRIP